MVSGDLQLKLPALPEYGRMVELAVAHVATHLGFSEAATTNLKRAIEEALLLLLDKEEPDDLMEIDLLSKAGIITLEARVVGTKSSRFVSAISNERITHFQRTAGPLVDSWKVDANEHRLWLQVTANPLGEG